MEDRAGGTHPGPSRIAKNPLPDKGPGERGLREVYISLSGVEKIPAHPASPGGEYIAAFIIAAGGPPRAAAPAGVAGAGPFAGNFDACCRFLVFS